MLSHILFYKDIMDLIGSFRVVWGSLPKTLGIVSFFLCHFSLSNLFSIAHIQTFAVVQHSGALQRTGFLVDCVCFLRPAVGMIELKSVESFKGVAVSAEASWSGIVLAKQLHDGQNPNLPDFSTQILLSARLPVVHYCTLSMTECRVGTPYMRRNFIDGPPKASVDQSGPSFLQKLH